MEKKSPKNAEEFKAIIQEKGYTLSNKIEVGWNQVNGVTGGGATITYKGVDSLITFAVNGHQNPDGSYSDAWAITTLQDLQATGGKEGLVFPQLPELSHLKFSGLGKKKWSIKNPIYI